MYYFQKVEMDVLRYIFNFLCFSIAFGMTVFWLYKFWKDEDLVQVDIKPMDTFPQGQHVELSFCFYDPIIESKLKEYNNTLTKQKFLEFLNGEKYYQGMEKIEVDTVTLNLTDFYLYDAIIFRDGTNINGTSPNFSNEIPQVTYLSMDQPYLVKCFGLRSKYKNAKIATFVFNSSVFPNGNRSSSTLVAQFHLSNRIMIAEPNSVKHKWPIRKEKKEHLMSFTLQQIEILKRRNKNKDSCISDDLKYDESVMNDHLDKVGCKALYHKTSKKLRLCESKEKLKEAISFPFKQITHTKPCTSAATISFTFEEYEAEVWGIDLFSVNIFFPMHYKEITMVKAIDFHSAIGNSGGYIGLFLGKEILIF